MGHMISRIKNFFLPQTLFGRSLLIIALPLLLLQLIVAFIFFSRHWDSMSDKLVFGLAGEIQILSNELANADDQRDIERIIYNARQNLSISITLQKNSGAESLMPSDASFEKFYWFSAGDKLNKNLHSRLSDTPFAVYPYERDKWFEIVVQIKPDTVARFVCSEKRLTSITTYIFILWLIGSAAILFAIAILFMRNQIRPILRLAVAAEKIGKGQDVPDFRPVGASEIRRASAAFIVMKDRLKRQIEQRTAMLSGVSHDLRTPMTRMKLQLALMPQTEDIEHLKEDIHDMEKMIDGYLTFIRGDGDEATEMANMKMLVERAVSNARRSGATVDMIEPMPPLTIRIRSFAIERAISNILSNAAKYAKKSVVTLVEEKEYMDLIIDDDGPGIPPEYRDDAFKPFFRLEKSRNPKTGGIGLGLSIAQDIIHAHGGEISLESSPLGGLRVKIRLPF